MEEAEKRRKTGSVVEELARYTREWIIKRNFLRDIIHSEKKVNKYGPTRDLDKMEGRKKNEVNKKKDEKREFGKM